MKKKAHRVVVGTIITSALFIVLLLVSFNTLVDKNRDYLHEEIQKALGRSLSFDELRLSLWGGLGLSAKNLRVADDQRFAATPFIQTKELKMEVRWLPLLLGKIAVKEFTLVEPEIQIIRNESGSLNVSTLAAHEDRPKAPRENGEKRSRVMRDQAKRSRASFYVSALRIARGTMHYVDRADREPFELSVRNLDMNLKGSGLAGTAQLKLAASLLDAERQNIKLEGRIGPFGAEREWKRYPVELNVDIDSLFLPQLDRGIPLLREKIPSYLGMTGPLVLRAKLLGTFERPRISVLNLTGPFFGATKNNLAAQGELDFSKGDSWADGEIKGKISVDPVSLNHLGEIPFFKQALPASLFFEGPLSVASEFQGSLRDLKARALIKAGESEIRYASLFKKPKGIAAQMEVRLARQKDRLVFEESTFTLHNLRLKFSGSLEDPPQRRVLLHLNSDAVNLSGWDRLLPPLSSYNTRGTLRLDLSIKKTLGLRDSGLDLRGGLSLREFQAREKKSGFGIDRMTSRASFQGKEIHVENSSLRLGSSELNLGAILRDLSQPIIRYTLRTPKLNLADLTGRPAYRGDEMKGLLSKGEVRIGKREASLQGEIFSSEGRLQDILYRNLRGEIAWSPKRVSFKSLSLQALNGTFRGNGSWERGAKESWQLTLDSTIEAMDLKALLSQKFPRFKDHIEGRLNFKARLEGEGNNGSTSPESFHGQGETVVHGGRLKDFNLVERVLSKITGLPGLSDLLSSRASLHSRSLFQRQDTPFDTLFATFTVEGGRIHTRDFTLATPDYSIHGEGWIGFDKATEWNATLVMSPQLTQELMREHKNVRYLLDRLGRLSVPFRLEGNLPYVQPKPDLKGLAASIQRGLLQRGRERALEGAKEQKKKERLDWIQKGLEQLFGK